MKRAPDETQAGRLKNLRKSHLAFGAFIALSGMAIRTQSGPNREACAECGAKIPPGKAGRKCQDCRRTEP